MPYDEQGFFYGSDDLNALEAKYTKPDYASQIPGQVSSSKSDKPQNLRDQAVSALMQYNPLMMRKSLQEASGAIGVGGLLPIVAPISAGVQKLNALPGNLYRKYLGEEEVATPTAEELMQKYSQPFAPKTPLGQEMTEGAIKAFQASKAEGLLGIHPVVARGVNPNDVRVAAGQVKQLAKELRETPQDFQAAQSGLKRQNLYGEDTIGVKAQAAADSLAETLERRKSEGKSLVPGLPEALTPETSMYAVRPNKSRIVQPVVPESARGFQPEYNYVNEMVSDIYGDTPTVDMPPEMVMTEYGRTFLNRPEYRPIREAVMAFEKQKALQMFPDAPDAASAQRAYDVMFNDRSARAAHSLKTIEEFLSLPENQNIVESGFPTPTQFMERMSEGERVLKGPFVNFITKNLGAEGDPTVKLARQGITFESPERIKELARYVNPTEVSRNRVEAGFPAFGTYAEEHFTKNTELDKLNEKIQAIEDIRQPLFDQAHAENRNPAEFPEYAETTQPLRLLLRDREKLQADIENIKLARAAEDLGDSAITPRTKERMLGIIPYEQRQFFPSVTKAGDNEKLYTVNRSIMNDMGYKKLGEELLSDILTGRAGETSKLTIENYVRQKHLTRVEAEKVAKIQEQQYRENLTNVLVQRLKDEPNAKTYGNVTALVLDKNTPVDAALRDLSVDTAILDICVANAGSAPQGRKNLLTNKQQGYQAIIDPITGKLAENVKEGARSPFVEKLKYGAEFVSFRDSNTGLPGALLEFELHGSDDKFTIGYASGYDNKAVKPEFVPAVRDYLNENASRIVSPGSRLADNLGIFDLATARGFESGAYAANLNSDQRLALKNMQDLPRFATSDDIKAIAQKIPEATDAAPVALRDESPTLQFTERDHQGVIDDYNDALMNAARDALENSNLENPERVEVGVNNIASSFFDTHLNDQAGFVREPLARLLRVERALEDRIASLHAQGSEYHGEVADALDNFLIDVRGIRGNIERRIRMAEERPAAPAQAPAVQGDAMPRMSADELLQAHGNRMTREQQQWLEAFIRNWEENVDGSPAGAQVTAQLSHQYETWLDQNRLGPDPIANLFDAITFEPDNTHPANNVALQQRPGDQTLTGRDRDLLTTFNELVNEATAEGSFPGGLTNIDLAQLVRENEIGGLEELGQADRSRLIELLERQQPALPAGRDPYELSARYDVPPGMIRSILTESNGPIDRLFELLDEALTPSGRFETLPEDSLAGAVQLIRDLLTERQQAVPVEPAAPARRPRVTFNEFNGDMTYGQVRDRIEEIAQDPAYTTRQIRRLRNLLEDPDHPQFRGLDEDEFEALASILDRGMTTPRGERAAPQLAEPQAAPQVAERAAVPRGFQEMSMPDLVQSAGTNGARTAQELADRYFADNSFNDNHPVTLATNALRNYNIGPHENAPHVVRELAARKLEQMYVEANQSAEQIAETLREVFYEDSDDAQAALNRIEEDIRMLRNNGEDAWEDLIGPMAEDNPWNPTIQSLLIEHLEYVLDYYRDARDNGYAKGGRVKKARTMPLVATRKNPELAEMTYQYGGMVR